MLPEEAEKVQWIDRKAREVFGLFGYREVRTPLLEETEVFVRSIGEDTDIVEKEMYSFNDRGGKSVALRPEGTASIVRAYIEQGWYNTPDLMKLFYVGPMFRGERPQKGRQRQFYQIGAEAIGGSSPRIDADLISNLVAVLSALKVEGFTVLVNTLGCDKDRTAYKKELKSYLSEKKEELCDDCKRRAETNVLRVLDCKKKECKAAIDKAPEIVGSLCEECVNNYETLKKMLNDLDVPYKEKKDLVRGLDYYTGTIFEVVHPSLGAQDAIAAGGRYDGLISQMGGPEVGATGYAIGLERLLLAVDETNIEVSPGGVLVVYLDEKYQDDVFRIVGSLRARGIKSEMDLTGRSFKGQMRKADREKKEFVILFGEDEAKSGKLLLKDMGTGEQQALKLEEVIHKLKGKG